MSALVCLYVIAITSLVAVAAAALEWALQGRVATRHLWSIAMLAAVILPPVILVQNARVSARPVPTPARTVLVDVVQFGHVAGAAMGARRRGTPLHSVRDEYHRVAARASRISAREIVALWALVSLGLVSWIVIGVVHWHRARRDWEEMELDGVRVHLSAETGPAVLGVLSQRIVLPAWVQALAPEYRQLMLAHECEHIAARDPQRLALALGALVLMPWNPALWWCAARMRRAIELDCDARVLRRHPAPRAYGYLLLQVAARGTNAGPLAVPLVNLLRLPSELELRLRAMTRPRTIAGRTALAGVACAIGAVCAAFTAPVPSITRTTVRKLAQGTRARLRRGEHVVVRVGSAVLQLDSATVDSARGTVRGSLRELRILRPARRGPGDTLPSAAAEDSIQRLARQLAVQARQLDSVRAQADSLDAAMRAMRNASEMRVLGGVERVAPGAGRTSAELFKLGRKPGDQVDAVALQREFAKSGAYIDAALAQQYPNLASDASSNTVIWFVADSNGKVLRTLRGEGRPPVISAQTVSARFPSVDPRQIDFLSMRGLRVGTRNISVAWIALKR